MRKKYFVANNLWGEEHGMQMTEMSEGLLLNSKYIKMGHSPLFSSAKLKIAITAVKVIWVLASDD